MFERACLTYNTREIRHIERHIHRKTTIIEQMISVYYYIIISYINKLGENKNQMDADILH